MKEAEDFINKIFNETKLFIETNADSPSSIESKLDAASKSINIEMIDATKKLASLANVNYFELLANIFDDEATERGEKVLTILQEAKQIYDEGERIFNLFQETLKTI